MPVARLPTASSSSTSRAGPTSFDVVRRIKRAARLKRVGHGGTLDPLASGVLPICVGEGTKLAQFLLDADKEYDVTIRLGVETDTYDADGAVTAEHDASAIDEARLRAALPAFTGAIEQRPPVYSALKRDGKPLYAYARAGETVEIAPRPVTVHELSVTSFGRPQAVGLHIRCSKGTYVRSLAFDIGRALGVGRPCHGAAAHAVGALRARRRAPPGRHPGRAGRPGRSSPAARDCAPRRARHTCRAARSTTPARSRPRTGQAHALGRAAGRPRPTRAAPGPDPAARRPPPRGRRAPRGRHRANAARLWGQAAGRRLQR